MLYSLPMSEDELDNAVGKLARKKALAQKQYTALILDVNQLANEIQKAGGLIASGVTSSPEVLKDGLKLLDEAIAAGGLDKLKSDLDKAIPLKALVLELQAKAKELGIE